jgi:hypothetical protein
VECGYNSIYTSEGFRPGFTFDPRINGKWPQETRDKMRETWAKKISEGYDAGIFSRGVEKSDYFKKKCKFEDDGRK